MILHATDLTKEFKKTRKKKAFRLHIDDFEVREGSFTAILGPNGSGKSTFIKLALDLIYPNEGTIELLGKDHKTKSARTELGYLPENFSLPERFTVRQVLKNFSSINPHNSDAFDEHLGELAQAFNVDYLDKRIKDLSKGMRQTAALLLTFMGQKQFYILDEPFNGLDAVQKKAIMSYIFELQQRKTLRFSSPRISFPTSRKPAIRCISSKTEPSSIRPPKNRSTNILRASRTIISIISKLLKPLRHDSFYLLSAF